MKGLNPEWIAALVALVVAVFGLLAWAGRWTFRVMRRVIHFLDDYSGRPEQDGRPAVPGLMARLQTVEDQLAHVVTETSPNHGRSIRDIVIKTAEDVADLRARLERTGK